MPESDTKIPSKRTTLPEIAAEQLGKVVGVLTLRPVFYGLEQVAKKFELHGEYKSLGENLRNNTPAIIAMNHIGPVAKEEETIKTSGITPDIFIQQALIRELTGRKPMTVAINEAEYASKNAKKRGLTRIKEALGRGFMKGAGMLPVNKQLTIGEEMKPNWNRSFMVDATKKLTEGNILTFFVEGRWRKPQEDLSEKIKVYSGAVRSAKAAEAILATDIPIIPVYIHCSDEWDENKKAYVYSGEPIYSKRRNRKVVGREIEQALIQLQKNAIQQNPGLLESIVRP